VKTRGDKFGSHPFCDMRNFDEMSRRIRWSKNDFSSTATLTGTEEKKTGPSRFRPDFSILSRLFDDAAFVGSIIKAVLVYKLLWTEH
jgi:hypothetical protein